MAGHGDLAAAAERVAVQGGDDRLREALDPAQHAVAEPDEVGDGAAGERRAEVGAGAEDPVARAGHDDRAHGGIGREPGERGVEVVHQLLADRVGRRAIEGDDGEALLAGDEQRSEEHTSELQSLAYLVCRLLLEKKKKIKVYSNYIKHKHTKQDD